MAIPDNPEPDTEPNIPPSMTKGDQYLFREIQKVGSHMSDIADVVNSLPAEVDAKIEPLSSRLAAIVQAIEALPKLSDNVERISAEFTGFRSFRDRVEGYEKEIKGYIKKFLWGAFASALTIVATAFYFGWTMSAINANVGDMKNSVEKLQTATYELNGTTKSHGEQLRSVGEQLKTLQVSMRDATGAAAETSGKASDRLAGVLEAFEKRINKNNALLDRKIDTIDRRIEESADVWVLSLTLTPEEKPAFKSDGSLIYEMEIPQQQRPIRAGGSKTFLAGAVTFFDRDDILRPPGVVATAYPIKENKVRIELYFREKSALEGFVKRLDELRSIRMKITFAVG
jgi:predicted  nucleic acid-binding Zn-ribbon protein